MTKLEEYKRKRNFERTGEPEGETAESDEGLSFVVQHHMARREHYDLRLEWNGVLLSWAVPKGPSYNTREKRLAVRVEDHPLDYKNFEGTIPQGEYGGGTVMLWDEGYWEPYADVGNGLRDGMLKFVLKGRRLKGSWALVRMKTKAGETKDNWLMLKEKDEYAGTSDGINKFNTSIRTGRTMMEIAEGADEKFAKNPFTAAKVQLAKLVNTVPKGENWIYELKYDGYRVIAFVEGNRARLMTRNGNDYTTRFQPVSSSLIDWAAGRAMVLDGEMTVTDARGKTDFQALQNYIKHPQAQNLTFIVFDLLALDGTDLRNRPLSDRKEMLEALMKDAPKNLWYSRRYPICRRRLAPSVCIWIPPLHIQPHWSKKRSHRDALRLQFPSLFVY
jgi:bifunctional non-homologous end joining protein LigD